MCEAVNEHILNLTCRCDISDVYHVIFGHFTYLVVVAKSKNKIGTVVGPVVMQFLVEDDEGPFLVVVV